MSKDQSLQDILAYPHWRQRIPIKEGLTTMGYLSLPDEWEHNYLPASLQDKSFIDVGSNDGYFCFEAERRGAKGIVAADLYHDGGNSNRTGWSEKGIKIIQSYLDSSVEIKTKSIYDLISLNRTFDYVLCTDVISWLDNINEAIYQLASVCSNTLYLKDGFLMKFDPDPVLQYEKPKDLVTFRANLSYITAALKINGFRSIEIKPIKAYRYFDWQTSAFQGVWSNGSVDVFEYPNAAQPKFSRDFNGEWALTEYKDFIFIRDCGWVKLNAVQLRPRIQQSWKSKAIRKILSPEQLSLLVRKRGAERYVQSHMVIAKK
jgi:SAM-dependent methyltransferase